MRKMGCLILVISAVIVFSGNTQAALPVTDGMVMHLDADSITGMADGAGIATWSDLSGAGNDATQAEADSQPTYVASNPSFEGHPTVRFDGTNDWMDLPSTTCNVGSFTLFAIAQYSRTDSNQYIVAANDNSSTANRLRLCIDTKAVEDVPQFLWRAGSSSWKVVITEADLDVHVFGETSDMEGFLDGVSVGTSSNTSTLAPDRFNIGSFNRGEKDFFSGDLAELVVYDHVLTAEEIASVSDYLALKWSTSYVTDPNPADGQTNVDFDVTLQWNGTPDPNYPDMLDSRIGKYYVYIDYDNTDTDPNLIYRDEIVVSDWSSKAASYGPLSLGLDDSVSWQIEEGVDDGQGGVTAPGDPNNLWGSVWSFTARRSIPVLPAEPPASVRVFPDEPAVFTVDFTSVSPATVKWYHDDSTTVTEVTAGINTTDDGLGNYTTTLSLGTPLSASDEGQYFCSVTNDDVDYYDSAVADLVVKRELAQYNFDLNLDDSSGNGAPTGVALDTQGDPNSSLAVPATIDYVTGADGAAESALSLDLNEYVDFGVKGYPRAIASTTNGFGGGMDEGTVVFWVKPDTDVLQSILGNLNDGTAIGFLVLLQADQDLDLYIRDAAGTDLLGHLAGQPDRPEYDLSDGNWHMMAACWSGDTATLYVDGQWAAEGTGTAPASCVAWQRGVLLGATRTSADRNLLSDMFAGGAIDNLRIYNYRLDAAGNDVFAQEYLDNSGIHPCVNVNFLDGLAATNLDNTGSSYCQVDLADFAAFAETWLANGLY